MAKHPLVVDEALQCGVDRLLDRVGTRDATRSLEEAVVDVYQSLRHDSSISDVESVYTTSVTADCSAGDSQEELEESRPNGSTGWHCRFDSCPGSFGNRTAYAICMKVE